MYIIYIVECRISEVEHQILDQKNPHLNILATISKPEEFSSFLQVISVLSVVEISTLH